MTSLRAEQAIALEFTCLFMALVFISLRIYTRVWLQKKFMSADTVLLIAWCFFAAYNAVNTIDLKLGLLKPAIKVDASGVPNFQGFVNHDAELSLALKAMFFSVIFYLSGMFFVKFSFLALYYTIIPPTFRLLRLSLNVTTIITIIGYILMIAINVLWCLPVHLNFEPNVTRACYAVLTIPPYAVVFTFHLLTDIMIYTLPFFLLPILRRSNGNSLRGLIAIFSLGFLSIAVTVIRAIVVWKGATIPVTGVLAALEQLVAILVACSPSLKWLWKSVWILAGEEHGGWTRRSRRRKVDEEGYEGDDEGDVIGYVQEEVRDAERNVSVVTAATATETTLNKDEKRSSSSSGIVVIGSLPLAFDHGGGK